MVEGEVKAQNGPEWDGMTTCVCTPLFLLLVVVLPFSLCVFLVMERTVGRTDGPLGFYLVVNKAL
jgi:hypothetical protein